MRHTLEMMNLENLMPVTNPYTTCISIVIGKASPPYTMLGTMFRIDQSTVSRYLKFGTKYDDEIFVVTPHNITTLIASTETTEELKEILPGRQGGEIITDGTLVETTHPAYSAERKKQYSGKGKMFAISTTSMINKKGYVVDITDPREGSCHNMRVFREHA